MKSKQQIIDESVMQHQSQEHSGKISAKKKERHQKWLNAMVDSVFRRPLGRLFFFKKRKT